MSKQEFANSLSDLGGTPPMSECMRYGMTWGCDTDCPVLQRGKCHLVEEGEPENVKLYKEYLSQMGEMDNWKKTEEELDVVFWHSVPDLNLKD
ncbi:hypothetical protein [Riemerella anatipestifer]|uniref:Uncharacterized protein n=1 Tax=Riemerella anatipestifer RA-CH-1 TaxID=1228997 RepID=J9QZ35_RIEAN|nr:hypothetical protein [Riemerella anatipestifer]AFR35870.1 hypothetical protein B739_1272 [Riemerella anatipestifer RA-CH-1]MCU7581619.1 hypothetical protein [Riemerella anatipestifer]MDD1549795.1 hypothetical protein [Riemerella anatipestifer]MDD1550106.1 hypothetical protein [Riemerella anatipestifer]MDR7832521.1 hypothetical protein [Riemerella anatipestifer]